MSERQPKAVANDTKQTTTWACLCPQQITYKITFADSRKGCSYGSIYYIAQSVYGCEIQIIIKTTASIL